MNDKVSHLNHLRLTPDGVGPACDVVVAQGERRSGALWLVSFADVLAIILCFMVLMFAFSLRDQSGKAGMVESLTNYFDAPDTGGNGGTNSQVVIGSDDTVYHMAIVERALRLETDFPFQVMHEGNGKSVLTWDVPKEQSEDYRKFISGAAEVLRNARGQAVLTVKVPTKVGRNEEGAGASSALIDNLSKARATKEILQGAGLTSLSVMKVEFGSPKVTAEIALREGLS